ncbi:glutamate-tRNA ligase [Tieghemostelium lacteum]|uniref:glutamate--tRNA ligase n=1 Tax=Tieghemostelium lacteum TaxID=361077 RepID=A0A151ZHV1_TIELA|nr:glutamate-tRNA ligase [Tieghemostelium lacteum]|eukprot:KYQ93450.1 glutamate-tRNA ligase [Tieghemostelium lacteum]
MANKQKDHSILRFDDTPLTAKFPLLSIITSKIVGGVKLVGRKGLENTELNIVGTTDSLQGNYVCAKYLARHNPTFSLYGNDAFTSSKIDQWIEKIAHISTEQIGNFITELNDYLQLRTFLVNFNITLADITLFSKITLVKEYAEEMTKKGKTIPHLKRWYSYLQTQTAFAESEVLYHGSKGKTTASTTTSTTTAATTKSSTEEEKKPESNAFGWNGNFESLNLPGLIKGKVVTRFPPEPSGYMHVGHCKAAIINNFYKETYEGKIILRFDDTNPEKEKQEYVDNLTEDIQKLGIKYEKITYTSDYFQLIMDKATQMIVDGIAYVDDTPKEKMSEEKGLGIESVHRNNSVEKNLKMWEEMKNGTEAGQKCVLRAKWDMQHLDKAFRDPPLYRCNVKAPHYRTGSKFKCYPLYDFACPIVDSIEGITHALRSNEYHNKIDQYNEFIRVLKLDNKPVVSDYSRLAFDYTVLSKRKLQEFVEQGLVDGWFDPRLPTLQGMLRRGILVQALRGFVLSLGATAAVTSNDMGRLWGGNKKLIENVVPRYTAVAKGAVEFTLTNGPEKPEVREIFKYNKDPSMGNKPVTYSNKLLMEVDDCRHIKEGEEITLMNWGNAIVKTIKRSEDGTPISMEGVLHLEGDFKKTEKKLTWLSSHAKQIPVILTDYDYIITKKKLDKGDEIKNFMNKNTKFVLDAIADENILTLKRFDKIQFERRGFFNVDKVGTETEPWVLIFIPDTVHKPEGQSLYPFKEDKSAPKPKPVAKKEAAQKKK